ncbi:GNAT family N-acetyltransferase [Microbacterium oxydans]|nr:GNAT family N-acetyltransferase [Microbacterium oxydans]
MSLTDAAAFPASPEEAADAANAAASKAGVEIRLLEDVDDFTLVAELFQSIWTKQGEASPVNVETLRALSKAGSYVGGAFEHDELVGACFGFFAAPEQRALHSHIAGVSSRMRGRSVGFALKVHQRAWALEEGLDEISWTFDPLISRNAHFNLVKLAGDPDVVSPQLLRTHGRCAQRGGRHRSDARDLVRARPQGGRRLSRGAGA